MQQTYATPTTPNGTMQTIPQKVIDKTVRESFVALIKGYVDTRNSMPGRVVTVDNMEAIFSLFRNGLGKQGVSISSVIDCYRQYHQDPSVDVNLLQTLGWLLAYVYSDLHFSIRDEFGLLPERNPIKQVGDRGIPLAQGNSNVWPPPAPAAPAPAAPAPAPIYEEPPRTAIETTATTALVKPDIAAILADDRPDIDPGVLLRHVPATTFIETIRRHANHILIVGDRVSDEPAVCNYLHAVMTDAVEKKRANPSLKGPEVTIVDPTGARYLGYKYVPGVVFHPEMLPPAPSGLWGSQDDPAIGATQQVLDMVPWMEGTYKGYEILNNRLKLRRKTESGKAFPQPHRYLLILRWWNVVYRKWKSLSAAQQEEVRKIWRHRYNRKVEGFSLPDVIPEFLSMADSVNCQLVITTKTVSTVDQLGIPKGDLSALLPIVPGDANAASGFGFSGINRILSDNRWDFYNFDGIDYTKEEQKVRLRGLLKLGIKYTITTGNQVAFVGGQLPTIMPLAQYHEIGGQIIGIGDIDSDSIKGNYEHAGLPSTSTNLLQ